jgi:sugar lactone lactonase YvrE
VAEQPRTPAGWRGVVSTLAGSGAPGYADGAARETRFADPFGVAVAADGSVYVADAGEANRIRKVSPEGVVTTLAGGREGFADGAGAAAVFNTPSALALDAAGNLYVADTGNNRVRKVTPEGVVTTLAGDGEAGFLDGPAAQARFDSPVGLTVDKDGNVYVADTYNDRLRLITKEGVVKTLAGSGGPGNADGVSISASFDTPCGVAVSDAGDVYVADTGNDRLRKISKDGQVTTLNLFDPDSNAQPSGAATSGDANSTTNADASATTNGNANGVKGGGVNASNAPSATPFELSNPVGLAITRDGFLYVTESDRSRVVQVAPDGSARVIAGRGPGFSDGEGLNGARFNQPAGLALAHDGSLVVADGANYLVRRVSPSHQGEGAPPSNETQTASAQAPSNTARPSPNEVLPRIPLEELGEPFPWPVDPQDKWHEVVGTMGEVRGAYGTDDSRDHLHSGLDVFGLYGQTVRVVREEKVASPLPNWGFGGLNEGVRVGLMTYVHLRVGRDEQDRMLGGTRFVALRDGAGKVSRVRVRRGTRLRVGDALGTINRMFHVHMNLGPSGAEVNPFALPLAGFTDKTPPVIESGGVRLFDESGAELKEKRGGRLTLRGKVRVVVDAYDQVDGNQSRRRLGLYRVGYQLLLADGSPAHGFESPRMNVEFNRLPPGPDAPKIAYADESGITVYGSQRTRFLYELTNNVRDGRASRATWDTSQLPEGDYTLRVIAADYAGNEAEANRDVLITIVRD